MGNEQNGKFRLTKLSRKIVAILLVLSMVYGSTVFANPAVVVATKNAAGALPGDVNGDGKVSLVDAQLALRASLRIVELTEDQLKRANVDNEEGFTKANLKLVLAQKILKISLGILDGYSTPWPVSPGEPLDPPPTEPADSSELPVTDQPITTSTPMPSSYPDIKVTVGDVPVEYVELVMNDDLTFDIDDVHKALEQTKEIDVRYWPSMVINFEEKQETIQLYEYLWWGSDNPCIFLFDDAFAFDKNGNTFTYDIRHSWEKIGVTHGYSEIELRIYVLTLGQKIYAFKVLHDGSHL